MSTTNTLDERISDLLNDVSDRIGTDRVADIFGGILVGAARTKGSIEKSLDALLGYTNIPSRAEHTALVHSVEALGRRIEVLAGRIDRLAATSKKTEKELGKITARRAAAAAKSAVGTRKTTTKAKAKAAKAKPGKTKASTRGRR